MYTAVARQYSGPTEALFGKDPQGLAMATPSDSAKAWRELVSPTLFFILVCSPSNAKVEREGLNAVGQDVPAGSKLRYGKGAVICIHWCNGFVT